MKAEDKELLLQVLSAMFPYGVIVRHADYLIDSDGNYTGQFWYKRGYLCNICKLDNMTTTIIESEGSDEEGYEHICDLERSLPYLRPMSSMTDEEWKELNCIGYIVPLYDGCFGVDMRAYCKNNQPHYRRFSEFSAIEDWLNKKMFDYHGLIPMGLALEAPEGMYNN